MTTLRRDLIKAIREVLQDYLGEDSLDSASERIADAVRAVRKQEFLSKSDPAWSVLAGEEIGQEQIDRNVLEMNACSAFEQALAFNPLEWDFNKEWHGLKRFVVEQYKKDPDVFKKYAEWRENEGKYKGAMHNKNILDKPMRFIDLFPSFMAYAVLNKPRQASISKDSNGVPRTY